MSVYSNWSVPANNTVFVLYASGRILSSLGRLSGAEPFREVWLTEDEKAQFIERLGLDDFFNLQEDYNVFLADSLIWVIEGWKDGRSARVQAHVSMVCQDGTLHREATYAEIPTAFMKIIETVCAFKGNSRPWHPLEFGLLWAVNELGGDWPICPWPEGWESLAPLGRASASISAPGNQFVDIEEFLKKCAAKENLKFHGGMVRYNEFSYNVSMRFTLPAESSWWHQGDGS